MPAVGALRDVDAGLVGDGDQLEVGVRLDVGSVHLGVTRVRRSERVVEPAHQRRRRLHHFVVEHAEQLVLQLVLGDAVMVVDAGLRAPADVEGGVHVRGGPVHDARELVPIIHVLKVEQLNRRSGDDHAVEALVLDLVEGGVERVEVLLGHVLRLVAGRLQQAHLDLQRGVRQFAHDLRLGDDLRGHEVEQQHLQRANVLVHGAVLGHHEDVLALEHLGRGQGVGDSDGHGKPRIS